MCDPKEPRYFATDFVSGRNGAFSLPAYLSLFQKANHRHLAVGEASPTYLASERAIPNILEFEPDAKFIVILRPQIDMARSLHARFYHDGREDVADFEAAWHLQADRRAGRHVPRFCYEPKELLYGSFCMLGEQLESVYRWVPSKQLMVILFEEFRTQTRAVYERVLDFLSVPPEGKLDFPVFEQNRRRRSQSFHRFLLNIDRIKIRLGMGQFGLGFATALESLNERKEQRVPLRKGFETELIDYFRPDVMKLSALIRHDLSHWLSSQTIPLNETGRDLTF